MRVQEVLLWDRKAEGGFPETKVLKQRVRDRLEPGRDLGHSDVGGKKAVKTEGEGEGKGKVEMVVPGQNKSGLKEIVAERGGKDTRDCEDCK